MYLPGILNRAGGTWYPEYQSGAKSQTRLPFIRVIIISIRSDFSPLEWRVIRKHSNLPPNLQLWEWRYVLFQSIGWLIFQKNLWWYLAGYEFVEDLNGFRISTRKTTGYNNCRICEYESIFLIALQKRIFTFGLLVNWKNYDVSKYIHIK